MKVVAVQGACSRRARQLYFLYACAVRVMLLLFIVVATVAATFIVIILMIITFIMNLMKVIFVSIINVIDVTNAFKIDAVTAGIMTCALHTAAVFVAAIEVNIVRNSLASIQPLIFSDATPIIITIMLDNTTAFAIVAAIRRLI